MDFSLYGHAWQAFLMFLAGLVSILASMAGYLKTGGGEDLLQHALISFRPADTQGRATFDAPLEWNFEASTLTVRGLKHPDVGDKENRISGLHADQVTVQVDFWPWPPRIDSVTVRGMHGLKAHVQPGFLQRGGTYPSAPPFPVYVEEADIEARIGTGPALKLQECSGSVKPGNLKPDGTREILGQFSLQKLNNEDFHLAVDSQAGGRWTLRGENLNLDTRRFQTPPDAKQPEPLEVDPLALLARALLTGESGARGKIASLRVELTPRAGGRDFECEGHVAYSDLELRLPPRDVPAGEAVPSFLSWMLGGKKTLWPPWLLADSIRTGSDGRISFHMRGDRLEFNCDEGPGSAFTPITGGNALAPLESFRGSVTTDAANRPQRVVLRGFLGDSLSAELRMLRKDDGARINELLLEPRAAGAEAVKFGDPLWRFRSRVEDNSRAQGGDRPLVAFDVEIASSNRPDPSLLPPGVRDIKGRLRIEGAYRADRNLDMDVKWTDGGLVYGGETDGDHPLKEQAYGLLVTNLNKLWGAAKEPWRLQDVNLAGHIQGRFDADGRWLETELSNWGLASGTIAYKGLTTDLGKVNLGAFGSYKRVTSAEGGTEFRFKFGSPGSAEEFVWFMELGGRLKGDGTGEIRFIEEKVPLATHPDRASIPKEMIEGWWSETVRRRTILRLPGGEIERQPLK